MLILGKDLGSLRLQAEVENEALQVGQPFGHRDFAGRFPVNSPAHPAGDRRLDGCGQVEPRVDAVVDVISEVAAVAAVEKISNPFGCAFSCRQHCREGNRPGCIRIRKGTAGAVEAPGFVGGWQGRVSHLRRFRFREATTALIVATIQSIRRNSATFCFLTPGSSFAVA